MRYRNCLSEREPIDFGISMGFVGKRKKTTDEALEVEIGFILRHSSEHLAKSGLAWLPMVWSNRRGDEVGSASIIVFHDRCTFVYQPANSKESYQQCHFPALFEWTDCNFGGQRPWFKCPMCRERCRFLYARGGRYEGFACRICQNLSYISQQQGNSYFYRGRAARNEICQILERLCRARTEYSHVRLSKKHERLRKRIREAEMYSSRLMLALMPKGRR